MRIRPVLLGTTLLASVATPHADALAAPAMTTERVSVSTAGEQGNGESPASRYFGRLRLSADGRFVVFASDASNLVRGDRNQVPDVFVRDRRRDTTRRVSVSSSGAEGAGSSFAPAMSADGRFVAFASEAPDLVAGDRNATTDVFVRDRARGRTVRVSVSSDGQAADGGSLAPVMSADGRIVAFSSSARNLAPVEAGAADPHVFVRDLTTGTTESIAAPVPETSTAVGDVSPDGRLLVLITGTGPVFVHDRAGRTTVPATGVTAFTLDTGVHIFGKHPDLTFTAGPDLRILDLRSGRTTCVVCWNGLGSATWTEALGVTPSGRWLAFRSESTRLVRGDTTIGPDVFVQDRRTGRVIRASVGRRGREANGPSGDYGGALSADGRYVAYTSAATNLVAGDTNERLDVFVTGPLKWGRR